MSKQKQKTIFVHRTFSSFSELGVFMYWTGNSMTNLLSYCGLVDAKIRPSDKELPVLSGTETIGHFLLDFLVIHKVKWTKKVLIWWK